MRQLKKVIGIVLIVFLLQLSKRWLHQASTSYLFYYNLISCYQLLILLYAAISILLERLFVNKLRRWNILGGIVSFLIIVSAAEGVCSYWLNHPSKIPGALFPYYKIYYDNYDSRVFQYEPSIVKHSDSLFYELETNRDFVFSNREFSDSFHINNAGFRDDDSSSIQPDILCVGDSYTLGWGNGQSNNFPSLIEKKTGLKVLNVSMSSYGTARELMLLQRIDLSKTRYIFWQYCFNDEEENRKYVENNFNLPVLAKKELDSVIELYKWSRLYFPFRHCLTICKLSVRKIFFGEAIPKREIPVDKKQEAKLFLRVLEKLPIDFSITKLVVFELRPYPLNSEFISQVDQEVRNSTYKQQFKENFLTIDASSILKREDFYILDVHIKEQGNKKIADALAKAAGF